MVCLKDVPLQLKFVVKLAKNRKTGTGIIIGTAMIMPIRSFGVIKDNNYLSENSGFGSGVFQVCKKYCV